MQLLLLERWFRSDTQEETRRHLQETSDKLREHLHRENIFEDRLVTLQGTLKDVVKHLHSLNVKEISLPKDDSPCTNNSLDRSSDTSSFTDSGRHELIGDRASLSVSDFAKVNPHVAPCITLYFPQTVIVSCCYVFRYRH